MKDSTGVEVMVLEQEKYGCVGLYRGWKRMIQELELQDLIHLGLDEYSEKCRNYWCGSPQIWDTVLQSAGYKRVEGFLNCL